MNNQVTVVCLTCQATLTLRFPDGWGDADGHFVAATGSAEEVADFHAYTE
jgi:hypothetical protein